MSGTVSIPNVEGHVAFGLLLEVERFAVLVGEGDIGHLDGAGCDGAHVFGFAAAVIAAEEGHAEGDGAGNDGDRDEAKECDGHCPTNGESHGQSLLAGCCGWPHPGARLFIAVRIVRALDARLLIEIVPS